ncbi:FAD-dependent oxidoreductase [Bacillus sp. RAR_GA_16]|uniref:FAD-dependent oxidoreductase n=1 Tax=Bacillus sp. RAR_GA_16 TaxID=2876774 RepID=UPI001CCD8445|nr:FAD-dependent oxidoreductase [Bacillus sp. RAR_GA_16]MCA0173620.1 FAD-dependent oxidoreductase [Bacillus sp. RAR_GA_16]
MNVNRTWPNHPEPIWKENVSLETYPSLTESISTEVVIVGGGITGITTAYLLSKAGKKVVLLEADRLLNGTTGHTTAKITAQHDMIYDELLNHFGKEKAKQYYEANTEALHFIRQTIDQYSIQCSFKEDNAYLYATTDNYARKLTNEMNAYHKLGIDGEFLNQLPIDLSIKGAISMKKQAHFNPVKYLSHLIKKIKEQQGQVYEQTIAVDIEKGVNPIVVTKNGARISCETVIACTHFPFYDGNALYFSRMYAERSYVIAAKTKDAFPGGMYLSADMPKRSLRSYDLNGENLVLIGGESHKAGQGDQITDHYKSLKFFGEETFGLTEVRYRWSAQDLFTLDKLPYIGPVTKNEPNILIATGFHKWGMTNGTAAALLFQDYLLDKDNPYVDLFSPSRFHADPSIKTFLVQNANVASEFVKGKLSFTKQISELGNDEAAIVRVNGKKAGAYKDSEGKLHVVDTTCTHLYCEVKWNDEDRTWDCPCHGSRFHIDGGVIEGPADQPLTNLQDELD